MRQIGRVILVVAVLCAVVSGPEVHATNDGDYYTQFYDSNQYEVGWHREDCDHVETWDGTQDGEWKAVTVVSCTTVGTRYEYYHKCGTGWRPVAYIGATATNC